jgi:hypothetical protein
MIGIYKVSKHLKMANKKNKCFEVFLVGLLLLVMAVGVVSAFGFSHPYTRDKPLTVYAGEVKDIAVRLKSSPDEGDIIVEAKLTADGGIASMMDSDLKYSVSPGNDGDGIVNIRLNTPAGAVVGDFYTFSVRFVDVTPSTEERGGMVGFTQSSTVVLRAYVVERPPEPVTPGGEGMGVGMWTLILIVIVVIVIIVVVVQKKKHRK